MPDPVTGSASAGIGPGGAAAIGAGASIVSDIANLFGQSKANKDAQKWQEKMYGQQRADALKDWAAQNEYNSPKAQMQRLRDAGLNPNLVYGSGNAISPSAQIRSSSPGSYQPKAPTFSGVAAAGDKFMQIYDLRQRKAEADLTASQQTLVEDQRKQIQAATAESAARTAKTIFDSTKDKYMFDKTADMSVDLMAETVAKLKEDIESSKLNRTLSINADDRAALSNNMSLAQGMESILTSRLQRAATRQDMQRIQEVIAGLKQDGELKALDLKLKNAGFTWSDPWVIRAGVQNDVIDKAKSKFNEYLNLPNVTGGVHGDSSAVDWYRRYLNSKKKN